MSTSAKAPAGDVLPVGLEEQIGPPESAPVPLGGGITNHNLRVRYGGRDVVVRLAGKDTGLLGSTARASARRPRRPPPSASARRCSPTSTSRPRSSPSSSPAA